MTYAAKKQRHIDSFNLMHEDEKAEYERVVNNPNIKIIERRVEKHTISSSDAFGNKNSNDYTIYIVEWEDIVL